MVSWSPCIHAVLPCPSTCCGILHLFRDRPFLASDLHLGLDDELEQHMRTPECQEISKSWRPSGNHIALHAGQQQLAGPQIELH